MLEQTLGGLFDTSMTNVISLGDFLLCVVCALAVGLLLAACYMYRTRYTKSFVATLALLPSVVCVVIMMVNGNVGAGVAVAGAFSLVRFRSVPGTAKEIGAIFLAMGTGIIVGMGYLGYAILCAAVLGEPAHCTAGWTLDARKKALCKKRCKSPSRKTWIIQACLMTSCANTLRNMSWYR